MKDKFFPHSGDMFRTIESAAIFGATAAGLIGIALLANPDYLITAMHKVSPETANWLSTLLKKSNLSGQAVAIVRQLPTDETSDIGAENSYGALSSTILTEFEKLQNNNSSTPVKANLYLALEATLDSTTHSKS